MGAGDKGHSLPPLCTGDRCQAGSHLHLPPAGPLGPRLMPGAPGPWALLQHLPMSLVTRRKVLEGFR